MLRMREQADALLRPRAVLECDRIVHRMYTNDINDITLKRELLKTGNEINDNYSRAFFREHPLQARGSRDAL